MAGPYAHVACCLDDSDAARGALREAARVAEAGAGRLSVVHVVPPPSTLGVIVAGAAMAFGGEPPVADANAIREMSLAWLEAETAGVPGAERVLLEAGDHDSAADSVCDWARQAGVDLLVAAAHRGAIERALSLVGSFSQYLAHHAPCPVLLVPPRPHPDQGTAG